MIYKLVVFHGQLIACDLNEINGSRAANARERYYILNEPRAQKSLKLATFMKQ